MGKITIKLLTKQKLVTKIYIMLRKERAKIMQNTIQTVTAKHKCKLFWRKEKETLCSIFLREKKREMCFSAPCKGKVVPLTEVPDPTFSEKLLGDGFAVIPTEGKVYAPADAEVTMVFDTLHAITLTSSQGA